MSSSRQYHELPPAQERATLLTLAAVQFTHILDFMIMMPLGAQLMRAFQITPAQFTQLVACYGLAAAVSGFIGGFVMDRFDRKNALLTLYAGFGLSTFACGLAPTHHALMLARLAAGAFGGLAGSIVTAMVGDFIPPHRRGRAMSWVSAAFPVASVLGVPLGLVLAGHYGWHAPFFLLAGCAAANFVLGSAVLPHLRTAIEDHDPARQMREILAHPIHRRAFALGTIVVMAGGVLIPFIAPSFVANVGLNETVQLPFCYAAGGLATMFTLPLVGWLSDRMDRYQLLIYLSIGAVAVVLVLVRMGVSSVVFASVMMALFMVFMSGRFTPTMTMVTNAVEARYRGGFMSVIAALQQAANGVANVFAGLFVTTSAAGQLVGLPLLGWISAGFFVLTVLCAAELRAAAPHVSQPGHPPTAVPVEAAA